MKKKLKKYFPISLRDTAVAVITMLAAMCLCMALLPIDRSGGYASMVFVLAVVCVARFTSGYLYSVVASFVGVVCTNYIFTYPYWALNFSIAGYPLTFFSMLTVSILTSAQTTQVREHERLCSETEKEKLRANLLRAISHDIRTPLTSIIGSISAVVENGDKLTESTKTELLGHAQEEAKWLINMVENLLSITRMNNGNALLSKQPEVVEEVVGGAVQKFRKRYPNVRITIHPPEDFAVASIDATLMEQVLINIMENAVLHGKNTTCITLTLTQDEQWVSIAVEDDGGGVDPRILHKILDDSFSQIREERSDMKRNMGIGLSVCRSIITAHGGSVNEPSAELHQYMLDAGKRSWQLFLDPKSANYVPNAQAILDSAASYRDAK